MNMAAADMQRALNLRELLEGIADAPAIVVNGVQTDSRRLNAGDVFLALPGARSHGMDFLPEAINAGVAAVVYDAATTAIETTGSVFTHARVAGAFP